MELSALANRNTEHWNKLEFQINNNDYFSLSMSRIWTYFYKMFDTKYTITYLYYVLYVIW